MSVKKQLVELFSETLRLAYTDQGEGRAFLLLHGGAGPASMSGLGDALARNARTLVPTHPGFNGEPRPDRFTRIDDLVLAYLALLEKLNLKNVVVVGNSVGGWIAAELALRQSPRVAGIVLLNAVGIDTGVAGREIVDPSKLAPAERAALSFHAPDRFAVAPSGPEAAAAMANNQRALRVYAGEPFMHDPTLRSRLAGMSLPAMVAWGESDRIVDVEYGRLYARCIPGARFELIPEAAHFPHIERLEEVARLIGDFAAGL
ncbi:MAG TPA: alpha/beta hydrolase [Cystobacter sp.]|jgi:pimeloyl-ACP methyl ester carboxylesterase